jgi:hypothetical protein
VAVLLSDSLLFSPSPPEYSAPCESGVELAKVYSIGWRSKNSQMRSLADTFRVERPSAADPGRPGQV